MATKKNGCCVDCGTAIWPQAKRCVGCNSKSEEFRRNVSLGKKGKPNGWEGRKFSAEHRRNISEGKKGKAGGMLGKHHSEETKRKISDSEKGKYVSPETRQKLTLALKGKKRPDLAGRKPSDETRRKMREAKLGPKSPTWKGGTTSRYERLRSSMCWRDWRDVVFKRDNYTCQGCGATGVLLHPHHEKPVSVFPELVFDVENGITLCVHCHGKIDHFMLITHFLGMKVQEAKSKRLEAIYAS